MIIIMLATLAWPLAPQDSTHPLGNNYAEFQQYGWTPYLHLGIDVMGITIGKPVYAVEDGVVKAWLTTSGEWHWRLAIADYETADSVEGWLYAHIDPNLYHKDVGDLVSDGELIGYLVEWPVYGFDHLHFSRIKDAGTIWQNPDWAFIENPLVLITPYDDTVKPVFENAYGNNLLALCQNNTSNYIPADSVTGDIDIIAKIHDETGYPLYYSVWERLIPFSIEYEIHGPVNRPPIVSFIFRGRMEVTGYVDVIYKDDNTCNTRGDYDYRDYYFIITNTDGDSTVETSDIACSWQTTDFPDGDYWIVVTAFDAAGNWATDSMMVTVDNVGVEEFVVNKPTNHRYVYPNPNNGNFTIYGLENIVVYDATGRLFSKNREIFKNIKAGVYFVLGQEKLKSFCVKLVVID